MMLEEKRLEGLVNAPEFPGHLDWLNTQRPISLSDLQGKIVLLDFWTFCCINCMHIIPDLKKLEAKYGDALAVIGIHSAKFTNEKDTESIRQAILRYGIEHPVLNDKDFEVWQAYSAHAWPTLVLINPQGKIIGVHSEEGVYDLFDPLIQQTLQYFDAKGEIDRTPLAQTLEKAKAPQTLLSFPGKISADSTKKRLFISDSNHHRILLADPKGKVLEVIGSGYQGQKDGSFSEAELNQPQGTVFHDGILYIADTENHLIRAADLKTRKVTTLLGTDKQANFHNVVEIDPNNALNSPWDLTVHQNRLYIAMAGAHQIWSFDLKTGESQIHAGSGREARIDGPLLESALAQPSGITTDGKKLYFADSEVSSIRSADFNPVGKVETLIGEDLFVYGDIDGAWKQARLQHPLGVTLHQGNLFVADTYNSKIKKIDLVQKTIQTLGGTGAHGDEDGKRLESTFFEPGGLAALDQKIYISDTNNHRIRILDLKTEAVSTFSLSGLEEMSKQSLKTSHSRNLALEEQKLAQGDAVLELFIDLPEGFKFTENAPFYFSWASEDESMVRLNDESRSFGPKKISLPLRFPVKTSKGFTRLHLEAVIYYCHKDSTLCLFENYKIEVPVLITGETQPLKAVLHIAVIPKMNLKR